jgi:hypothetical protein
LEPRQDTDDIDVLHFHPVNNHVAFVQLKAHWRADFAAQSIAEGKRKQQREFFNNLIQVSFGRQLTIALNALEKDVIKIGFRTLR